MARSPVIEVIFFFFLTEEGLIVGFFVVCVRACYPFNTLQKPSLPVCGNKEEAIFLSLSVLGFNIRKDDE